jgi:CheY-like chemotaxis protein
LQYLLLLEDDDDFRELLADLLSAEGYMVVEANNAQKAIELCQTRPFKLILSDVRMAGEMDGVAAIEKIQTLCPGIRSIVMTGFADLDVPLRAARLKADDYLLKPFELRDLSRVVSSVLQRRDQLPPHLLARLFSSARTAGKWLFDRNLKEVQEARRTFYQQFFLLIRSGRVSVEEAHQVFGTLEQLETAGRATDLSYIELGAQLMDVLGGQRLPKPSRAGISMPEFRRLFERLRGGKAEASHFENAISLYHNVELRRSDLQAYATYCWLWEEEPQEHHVDRFLGLHFGKFTIDRCLLGVGEVRLYSLTRDGQPTPERILCFPADEAKDSMRDELSSGRADYLKEISGHHFLFYAGDPGVSSITRLCPKGTPWTRIWGLLRPLFSKLGDYHQRGEFSGCFTFSQVRFNPDQECTILDFGPQGFQRAHIHLRETDQQLPPDIKFLLCCAPEALITDKPTHRSDQFVAGRIVIEALNLSSPELQLLDENGAETLWPSVEELVGPQIREILQRLCHPRPAARYSNIWEAMQALDSAKCPVGV